MKGRAATGHGDNEDGLGWGDQTQLREYPRPFLEAQQQRNIRSVLPLLWRLRKK